MNEKQLLIKSVDNICDLVAKEYSKEGRYYHNTDHLDYMVDIINSTNLEKQLGDNTEVFQVAFFFHDAIYDPKSKLNEENSVNFFLQLCPDTDEELKTQVANLILATKHDGRADTFAEKLLCDLDLAGLGDSWEVYSKNAANIRKEYGHLNDEEWSIGRKSFLQSMLDKPKIYYLEEFADREDKARENIKIELHSFD